MISNITGTVGKLNHQVVLEGLLKGKKKIDIAKEAGSHASSRAALSHSLDVTVNSKSFKAYAAVSLASLKTEVTRLIQSMSITDLKHVEYRDKANALSKLIEKVELLEGRSTHRIEIDISEVKNWLSNA